MYEAGFINTLTAWLGTTIVSLCGQCGHTVQVLSSLTVWPVPVSYPVLMHCAGFIRTQTVWPGAMTVSLCGPAPASCRISALSTLHTSSTHTESRMFRKITVNIMIHLEDMTFVEFIYLLSTLISKADH